MPLEVDPLKCIGCSACEVACNFYRDETFAMLSSSLMLYRGEEKKNYFALILKTKDNIILFKPEGKEIHKLGGGSGKPIAMRPSCDDCPDPLCVKFCPTSAIWRVS